MIFLELLQMLILGALIIMVVWHHMTLRDLEGEHEMRCGKCTEVGKCPAAYSWNVKFPCAEFKEEENELQK